MANKLAAHRPRYYVCSWLCMPVYFGSGRTIVRTTRMKRIKKVADGKDRARKDGSSGRKARKCGEAMSLIWRDYQRTRLICNLEGLPDFVPGFEIAWSLMRLSATNQFARVRPRKTHVYYRRWFGVAIFAAPLFLTNRPLELGFNYARQDPMLRSIIFCNAAFPFGDASHSTYRSNSITTECP